MSETRIFNPFDTRDDEIQANAGYTDEQGRGGFYVRIEGNASAVADFQDHSGTINNANQSQPLMAVNQDRKYLLVINTSTTPGDNLAINTNGAASFGPGSILIEPKGYYEPDVVPKNAITIIGANAAQGFTAKEG